MKILQFVVSLTFPLILSDIVEVPFAGLSDMSSLIYWLAGSIAIYATWNSIKSMVNLGVKRAFWKWVKIEA